MSIKARSQSEGGVYKHDSSEGIPAYVAQLASLCTISTSWFLANNHGKPGRAAARIRMNYKDFPAGNKASLPLMAGMYIRKEVCRHTSTDGG